MAYFTQLSFRNEELKIDLLIIHAHELSPHERARGAVAAGQLHD